jgi:hypothetical protein
MATSGGCRDGNARFWSTLLGIPTEPTGMSDRRAASRLLAGLALLWPSIRHCCIRCRRVTDRRDAPWLLELMQQCRAQLMYLRDLCLGHCRNRDRLEAGLGRDDLFRAEQPFLEANLKRAVELHVCI